MGSKMLILFGLASLVLQVITTLWLQHLKLGRRRVYLRHVEPDSWNVLRLLDERGSVVPNLVAVRAEFWTRADEEAFAHTLTVDPALQVLLVSSYQEFPAPVCNPFEAERAREPTTRFVERFADRVLLWCHCFRDPDSVWLTSVPKLLLSESDLLPRTPNGPRVELQYDFVASVGPGPWNAYIRNLDTVVTILNVASRELGARCVLVGDVTRSSLFSERVDVLPFLKHSDFIDLLRRSKFLVCAAKADASPRILVEAGREGCALLVQRHLLGGWKYVVPGVTGHFFDGTANLSEVLWSFTAHFHNARESIRAYFARTSDPDANAAILANAIYLQKKNFFSSFFSQARQNFGDSFLSRKRSGR